MAEVQHLKDKGIPLKIDGSTRYVRGATKYTTCADVIKMVLKRTGIGKEYRHLFGIYEVSLFDEKQIPCKTRILKVIESWRGVPNKLVLRRTEPMASVANAESQEPRKSKLGKKKVKSPLRAQTEDSYMKTLISLARFVEKQKNKLEVNHVAGYEDSTTDSDSSMDEFLSSLDRSKMAGFVHFFAAMAGGKHRKSRAHARAKPQTSDSDESNDISPSVSKKLHWKRRKEVNRRQQLAQRRKTRKAAADDVHPNKIHRVERVNFGFVDVEPVCRDQIYNHIAREPREPTLRDPRSRINPSRPCTARRRLLPTKKSTYRVSSKNSSGTGLLKDLSSSCTSDDECHMIGTFRPIRSAEHGLDRLGQTASAKNHTSTINYQVDYLHDSPLPLSDFDTAFVGDYRFRTVDINTTETHTGTDIPAATSGCDAIGGHKLVDYAITDDESDETESDFDSACSKCSFSSGSSVLTNSSNVYQPQHSETGCDVICDNDVTNMADRSDVSDYIRSLFNKSCVVSEDEAMNSFMKSLICEDDSDEGLSSMESDLDKDCKL